MKRLLIIGASILQLPAIKKAKEMGLYVAVADFNPNAIGIQYADEYFNVSTIDEEGIFQVAKRFKADGIMTLATDMPMRSLAYATHKLGLPGISYDTAIKATDKGEMIKVFAENKVAHPWYFIINNLSDVNEIIKEIDYPCISKPLDNSGSRGVMLINTPDELLESIKYSSSQGRKGGVIIEEYLQGKEVSVEVIVMNGQPNVLQVTDKLTTGAPHFVEMGHNQPSLLPADDIVKIKKLAEEAVVAVGIKNGPAHVEIMLTKKGPKMIELGARMGGDCITTHLVPLSTGIDMVEATIKIALGETPNITNKYNRGSAIKFIDAPIGKIKAIDGLESVNEIKELREISFVKNVGDYSGNIGNSSDRIGYVICQAEDASKAIKKCDEALEKIKILIE